MKRDGRSLEVRRAEAWRIGIEHREALVTRFMLENRLSGRPLLKDIVDDLIIDIQQARLVHGALPLDTFAQTESVAGRLEVTINSRIADMPNVKYALQIEHVAKWHESIHIARDFGPPAPVTEGHQPMLAGFEEPGTRLIMCRRSGRERGPQAGREFVAESAALAAVIAPSDLQRCAHFSRLKVMMKDGGIMGSLGWNLLYRTAEFINVNPSAMITYFTHRQLLCVEQVNGRNVLISVPRLFGGVQW